MELQYFVSTIHRDGGNFTKGIQIFDNRDAAILAMHNEFTAWGYGKKPSCDYVCAYIHDSNGAVIRTPEVWVKESEE